MVKVGVALLTALMIVAAGFIVLPKLLLRAPGTQVDSGNRLVPLGRTGQRSGDAGVRRLEEFATLQAAAGFTPLTPASLPTGYQPWEQYIRSGDQPAIVTSYRNGDGRYIVIVERSRIPNAQASPEAMGHGRGSLAEATAALTPQPPILDFGGTKGFYRQGLFGPELDTLIDALGGRVPANMLPHMLLLSRGPVEVTLLSDQSDVPREQLILIAVGLH